LGLVIVQGTNFIATAAVFYFNGLDNLGRRTLLLGGALGMATSLFAAGGTCSPTPCSIRTSSHSI
jgi:hypothetical protein